MSWDTWLQCMSIGIDQNTSIFIDTDKFWLRCRYAVIICAVASPSLDMDRWFIYQIDKDSRKYIPSERRLLSPSLCIKQICVVYGLIWRTRKRERSTQSETSDIIERTYICPECICKVIHTYLYRYALCFLADRTTIKSTYRWKQTYRYTIGQYICLSIQCNTYTGIIEIIQKRHLNPKLKPTQTVYTVRDLNPRIKFPTEWQTF